MSTSSTSLQAKQPPLVLVIEDQASIADLLAALMAPMKVQLHRARDGGQALKALSERRPALITLDLVLPGIDGFGLLGHIRQRPELDDVPVLAITAQTDSATQKRAYRSGISDFIAKPFSVDLLEAKLKMWLRLSQLADYAHQMRDFTHEAKNPLAAIGAAAQVLGRPDADAAMRTRLLRTIEEEADRLGRLLSSYTLGETSATAGPGTLSPLRLLRDVIEVNLPDKGARSRVRLRCQAPIPALRVDPDRLRQMLVNLLENAVAATVDGGQVDIEAFVDEAGVALSVRDSGVGIRDADLPRIFEDGFTTRGGTARGLGLGITRRLCLASGGKIQVASTPEAGASFTLWFPR